jgi:hypothetical protein
MASLPFISFFAMLFSSLLFLNGDDRVGAGPRAGSACDARSLIDALSGVITLFVELGLRDLHYLLRARSNAKPAAFAAVLVNGYFGYHKLL